MHKLIIIYNTIFVSGLIMGLPMIIPLALTSYDQRKKALNRFGFTRFPLKPSDYSSQKPIWIHALSLGEVISAIPLVKEMHKQFHNQRLVFSASTTTGFQIANKQISKYTDHIFYFPYDLIFSVKQIIKKVDPKLVIIVETDVWPNFLTQIEKRNIPVILVNARLSERSFSGYKKLGFFSKSLFNIFAEICVQSKLDMQRFIELGVCSDKIRLTGNMKFDQISPDNTKFQKTRKIINISEYQKVFVAGSTHKGEEHILIQAFLRLKKQFPNILFILAPRNPDRADSVIELFKKAGFQTIPFTSINQSEPIKSCDLIVVDIIGKLKEFYSIADIAFIGGSLVNCGGHNPLEPAAYSKPIIFGPDMSDFKQIAKLLISAKGAIMIRNAKDLYEAANQILKDKKKADQFGLSAFNVFITNKGALEKTLNIITQVTQNHV